MLTLYPSFWKKWASIKMHFIVYNCSIRVYWPREEASPCRKCNHIVFVQIDFFNVIDLFAYASLFVFKCKRYSVISRYFSQYHTVFEKFHTTQSYLTMQVSESSKNWAIDVSLMWQCLKIEVYFWSGASGMIGLCPQLGAFAKFTHGLSITLETISCSTG